VVECRRLEVVIARAEGEAEEVHLAHPALRRMVQHGQPVPHLNVVRRPMILSVHFLCVWVCVCM
jgi:hypothetical protein